MRARIHCLRTAAESFWGVGFEFVSQCEILSRGFLLSLTL